MADHVNATAPVVSREQGHDGEPSRGHTWSRADLVERIFVERLRFFGRVSRAAWVDAEGHEVLHVVHPRVEVLQVIERSGEKTCADEQQKRKCHLRGDEGFSGT